MSKKPIIGYTLDFEFGGKGEYSLYPWYAMRENYFASTTQAGGIPLPLPHELDLVEEYLNMIDGLIVTGGDFDVPPHYYGQAVESDTVSLKERRTAFELAMTRGALERNLPVLGICGGQQLLAVALGGTLIQHIPDTIENPLPHEQPNPRNEAGHSVKIEHDTLLHRIVGKDKIEVNSAHHQAVETVGDRLIINSTAPDGVIEGVECSDYKFCLGVQWHPEFHITGADTKIFAAFIEAAKR
ncbi:MAG: gamma-glutamyl-gamma-aminobutyrate hydrolase family protein [Rickettsiales bacterium]|nr:gamma-glutamyl-gamma-aminobutyrate hydrolase family protein [Rickettsiales bacterium]